MRFENSLPQGLLPLSLTGLEVSFLLMPELSSNFKNEHEVHFTSSYITPTTADAGDPLDPVLCVCSETKRALFVLKYNHPEMCCPS